MTAVDGRNKRRRDFRPQRAFRKPPLKGIVDLERMAAAPYAEDVHDLL